MVLTMQKRCATGDKKSRGFFCKFGFVTHSLTIDNYHSGIYFLGKEGLESYSADNESSIAEDA
jgi:hypothetical protein